MDRIVPPQATRDRLKELLKEAQDAILRFNREVDYTRAMLMQIGVPLTDEYAFISPDEGWVKKEVEKQESTDGTAA